MKHFSLTLLLIIGTLLSLSSCGEEKIMKSFPEPEIFSYYVNVPGLEKLTPDDNGFYQLPANLKRIRKGNNVYKSLCTYEKALSITDEHNHSVDFPPFMTQKDMTPYGFTDAPEGLIALGIFRNNGTTVFEWEDGTEDVITVKLLTEDRFHPLGFSLTLNGKPIEPTGHSPHTQLPIYIINLTK